jgi:hypothetical protein
VLDQCTWRGPRKKDRPLELNKLMADLDASQSAGKGFILFEMDRRSLAEARRLLDDLAKRWKDRGKRLLVVDAHPAEPFISGRAEGFSEMLHYGSSPSSLKSNLSELDADFIGAGGMGDLAPLDPAEPARSLRRLAASADRVILLADSRDSEGLLDTLIEESVFRVRLSDPELDEHLARLASRRGAGRQRLMFFLIIPLLMVLVYLFLPDEEPAVGIRIDPPSSRISRALPENAELPYFGGSIESKEDSVILPQAEVVVEFEVKPLLDLDVVESGKPAPPVVYRRDESRDIWNSVLDHKGNFHVHVSSFRDSARAILAQEREGYSDLPITIQSTVVKGRTWYRVHVGCFPDLVSAVAFRDSLLDQAAKEFCVIGIDPEP